MKFDANQGRRLQEFLAPVCSELLRISEPGAAMLCFTAPSTAGNIPRKTADPPR